MATLIELFAKRNDSDFRNRVAAACWRAAKGVFTEGDQTSNHTERLVWAKAVFADNGDGPEIQRVFIAANVLLQDEADPADVQIQASVDQIVDKFAV